MPKTLYRAAGKRTLDLSLAGLAIVATLPIMGAVALLVKLRLGSPVLFRQSRPGRDGRPFTLLKFRTMLEAGDAPLPDRDRLTPLGRTLRRWSLDELPELVNVLRGEMSLVGPRPLLMEYLGKYSPEQARRHEVAPGITGWAQVHGRNETAWDRRLELDVWYVDRLTLWIDLRILARTLIQVFTGAGVSAEGHATMPKFEGSSPGASAGTEGEETRD